MPFFCHNRLAWRRPSVVCVGGPFVLLRASWGFNRGNFNLIGGEIECGIDDIRLTG